MKDSADQLQAAHIALLKADTTLQGLVGTRDFDCIPERTHYPVIVYHIPSSTEWDSDGCNGDEHQVYVHVYDDYEGSKRPKEIMQRVYELLHDNTALSLTDHRLINCRRELRTVDREGQLYHGIGVYRAVTVEN